MPASELQKGDKLKLYSGKTVSVENIFIEELQQPVTVYNFEVEDWHTYFVSKSGVLVHNDCAAGGTGSKGLTGYGNKSEGYLTKRGWTWDSADDVVNNPYTTRVANNKSTGNPATAYYNKAGDYVVIDDVTGELVQTSKLGDTNWIPDSSIVNPYKP